MVVTTRQMNAALNGVKLAYNEPGCKDSILEDLRILEEALELSLKLCLKKRKSEVDLTDEIMAKIIIDLAEIFESEKKREQFSERGSQFGKLYRLTRNRR